MTKAQEPDWKALVLEHNADCDSRCDMDACGYKGHFEFSNRRCPTCPVKQKIDVNYATQPAQEPVEWRDAAIRLGEELSSVGPNGYYDMGAKEWLDWAMEQNPKGKHSLSQRPWVGLTTDELNMIGDSMRTWYSLSITDVYTAIEAKLKERNT